MRLFVLSVLLAAFRIPAVTQVPGNVSDCPRIIISCADSNVGPNLTLSVRVAGAVTPGELTYKWSVSAGTIVAGQGSESIKVDMSGVGGQLFTATVEVSGLPQHCPKEALCSIVVCGLQMARKIIEYNGTDLANEKARLDDFAAELKNDPTAMGYILSYAGRRARKGEAPRRGARAKSYLIKERGLDEARIVVIDGGHREERVVELFIVPSGATPPTASPTVAPEEVKVVIEKRRLKAAKP